MGKKYIVEIGRLERLYKAFIGAHGKPSITWLSPEVDLTPYTEPDLEQARKEAYEQGYENGFVAGHLKAEKSGQSFYEDGYNRGLADAWDAARKIIHMPEGDLLNIFTECYSAVCTALQVLLKYDASECIEKIQAYEQEKEEINVGDEVIDHTQSKAYTGFVIEVQSADVLKMMSLKDGIWSVRRSNVDKTGRHFDEVEKLLEAMRT